ncbi:MAG TPA: ABC transporter substrate-binding protein [Chitinophagaceae bacterium]|nr:ABC transporter substrate-binding protein [Chitinophagaceae bacterium]
MNVGILFPRSNAYPLIGSEFTEGLKAFTSQAGLEKDISFFPESIGFGGVEKEVYGKAEKLLMMDDVDILVAFIDERILELLKPLVLASGKLMIIVNPGANHPFNWIPQPNMVSLSLQHAFLCALSGFAAAAGKTNVPAAVATTFYDCGYLHLADMVREFQSSRGKIQFNYINNQLKNETFHIQQLTNFLSSDKDTQTILCVFDSQPASQFYTLLNEFERAADLNLFVSPMMLEKKALENIKKGFDFSITGYMPWHPSVPHEENGQFINFYREKTKKEPGVFSVLGWETGIILKEVYDHCREDFRNGETVTEMLKTRMMNGPRGLLKLDPDTQHFISPAIRCTIAAKSNKMEMEYDLNLENEWEEFTEKPIEGQVSGWTNTYLCY